MKTFLKCGGIAALLHAAAYLVGIALGVTLIFPILNANPDQYVAFVSENQALVYLWNLICYWGSAITLVIMVLALYHRFKATEPALAQTATVFGLIWAALIIGSANLMLHDSGVIASLYEKNSAQAAAVWPVLEAVENGIVSGNELVGSLWVLLISIAAWRSKGFGRAFLFFGIKVSLVGILTMIPGLAEPTRMIFGLGMIVWSVWLGVVLLAASRQPFTLAIENGGTA